MVGYLSALAVATDVMIKRLRFWLDILRARRRARKRNILRANGVHVLTALMGGGKTLTINVMLQDMISDNQFIYVTDRAHVDALKCGTAVFVELMDCFSDGVQIKQLPLKINDKTCAGIVVEEVAIEFNRRKNRNASYNDKFLGWIEMIVSLRHQGIPAIYILSQSYELVDIQLHRIASFKHVIYPYKKWSYDAYKHNDKLLYLPSALTIVTYPKNKDNFDYDETRKSAQRIKIDYKRHILSYNHVARRDYYNSLPMIKID